MSAIKQDLITILNLSKDFLSGRYKGVSKESMIMIIAALIYLVNPMDIVPDMLLGIGFLDDISVFTYLIAKIKSEIDKYDEWSLRNQY
ncbi:YkvA family protein [Peptoniphilus asaccharolyticus]